MGREGKGVDYGRYCAEKSLPQSHCSRANQKSGKKKRKGFTENRACLEPGAKHWGKKSWERIRVVKDRPARRS